jgi:D-threo-aldose 1-dehydrogenase
MSDYFNRRPFGKTKLEVTPLCIGCAPLGDMPEVFSYGVPEALALDTLRAFFKSSINFFDTAASYGNGESERRIGLAIKELGGVPPGYVLATKADRDMKTNDFSGDQIRRSVERSLKLLGVDRIPIMHLHDPEWASFDTIMAKGGAMDVLKSFQSQGVIDYLGVAGGPTDLMIQYVKTDQFDAVITHNRYTLVNRNAEPLLAMAHAKGIAVLNAAPYGSGILAKGPSAYPRYAYQEVSTKLMGRVVKMDALCAEHEIPLAAAALQFSLRDPRITSTILGISKPERLAQTLELAAVKIPDSLWPKLDAAGFSTEDPETDRWK